MASQGIYLGYMLVHAVFRSVQIPFPMVWVVANYVWHFVVLPVVIVALLAAGVKKGIGRFVHGARRFKSQTEKAPVDLAEAPRDIDSDRYPTRRTALAYGMAAIPPLVTGGLTWQAVGQLREFRVRRVELDLPTLPSDLDGVTIAHVTDLHIGPFLPPGKLERVADATNALEADLIAFTGDLNDQATKNTRRASDFLRRLAPRQGFAMIEGNHDVMNDTERFELPMLEGGFPLLLDDALTFRIPGRATAIQMLGISWGDPHRGREIGRTGLDGDKLYRLQSTSAMKSGIARIMAKRDPQAFPVFLAHHPHAFDLAADAGLPLTLSGHTHGGQIMLTEQWGAGPLRFRYWSGLYRKPTSQLFVANGVGAWFPLRLNAPAEIVHITLRSGAASPVSSQKA